MTDGLGMTRAGVDRLHLVYLNFFKHYFKYSIHEPLPDSKKHVVREYLKAAGYDSDEAASDEDDPVKRWIGREVKRFLHEADVHLPFLLGLASARIDTDPETEGHFNAAGEEMMDISDDEDAPTEEEVAAEQSREPLVLTNAKRWDDFLDWVRDDELPWTDDSDEYRKARA
eukprot:2153033-Prymnesium_polylepis.1